MLRILNISPTFELQMVDKFIEIHEDYRNEVYHTGEQLLVLLAAHPELEDRLRPTLNRSLAKLEAEERILHAWSQRRTDILTMYKEAATVLKDVEPFDVMPR